MEICHEKLKIDNAKVAIRAHDYGHIHLMIHNYNSPMPSGFYFSLDMASIVDAYNLYRILGRAIGAIQPGLVDPLPEGDPNEVDAMKVVFEADQRLKEVL